MFLGIEAIHLKPHVRYPDRRGVVAERARRAQTAVIAPAHVGKLARAAINDYSPQFPLRLMNKDFRLILKAAAQEHLPMPATEAAFRVNLGELAHNHEEDFSAVLRRMEEVAGIAAIHSAPVTR
jgi:3-hydroxyisobutyrate dehydrogenase-like beta-hydroxyacid dehydrogenase